MTLRQKFFLSFTAVLLTIVCIEVALRLAGFIYIFNQTQRNRAALATKQNFRILCLGESTTAIDGENSYPSQLERRLNQVDPKTNYAVINKGIPGRDTGYIVSQAENWVNQYQPDLVIVMMGINDPVELVSRPDSRFDVVRQFFTNLRVVKLFRWINTGLKARVEASHKQGSLAQTRTSFKTENQPNPVSSQPAVNQSAPQDPSDVVKSLIVQAPNFYKEIYAIAMFALAKEDFARAEPLFRRLIDMHFNRMVDINLYKHLGVCLLAEKKYKEFVPTMEFIPVDSWSDEWVKKICTEESKVKILEDVVIRRLKHEPEQTAVYDVLAACYRLVPNEKKADYYSSLARRARRSHLNMFTEKNFHELARILTNHHLPAIIMQYPLRDIDILKLYLAPVMIDHRDTFVFLENKKNFQDALRNHSYDSLFKDHFAGDFGHSTFQGNTLIAGNVTQTILKFLHKTDSLKPTHLTQN